MCGVLWLYGCVLSPPNLKLISEHPVCYSKRLNSVIVRMGRPSGWFRALPYYESSSKMFANRIDTPHNNSGQLMKDVLTRTWAACARTADLSSGLSLATTFSRMGSSPGWTSSRDLMLLMKPDWGSIRNRRYGSDSGEISYVTKPLAPESASMAWWNIMGNQLMSTLKYIYIRFIHINIDLLDSAA